MLRKLSSLFLKEGVAHNHTIISGLYAHVFKARRSTHIHTIISGLDAQLFHTYLLSQFMIYPSTILVVELLYISRILMDKTKTRHWTRN